VTPGDQLPGSSCITDWRINVERPSAEPGDPAAPQQGPYGGPAVPPQNPYGAPAVPQQNPYGAPALGMPPRRARNRGRNVLGLSR
jgi:hypothetical protein